MHTRIRLSGRGANAYTYQTFWEGCKCIHVLEVDERGAVAAQQPKPSCLIASRTLST